MIIFFTTARVTQYMSMLFNRMGLDVLDIHSRKSQGARTKTSDTFRKAKQGILFSSDVRHNPNPNHNLMPKPKPLCPCAPWPCCAPRALGARGRVMFHL